MTLELNDELLLPTLSSTLSPTLLPTLALAQKTMAPPDLDFATRLLTTANIIYCLPDHPLLLKEFMWQDYDHAPRFPVLSRFIAFWQRELEGKIHTVQLAVRDAARPVEFQFYAKEYALQ